MDQTHIADQLLTASAALAGLVLVFLSNVTAGFSSFDTTQQDAVRCQYRWRGWFAFGAFTVSVGSALAALSYYWAEKTCLIDVSAALLVIGLLAALVAAFISAKDIG